MNTDILSAFIQGACTILGGVLAAFISRSKPEENKENTPSTAKVNHRWSWQIAGKRWFWVVIGLALGFLLGVVVNRVILPLPPAPPVPKLTQTPTSASTSTPVVNRTATPSTPPSKESAAASQPTPIGTQTPTPGGNSDRTPTPTQVAGPTRANGSETPPVVKAFRLPRSAPNAVIWSDSALWVQFGATFERLKMLEAEGRFRLDEKPESLPNRTLRLTDRGGNVVGTLKFPFSGEVMAIDDQGYLWIAQNDAIKKYAPTGNGQDYREIDSYAPAAGRFPDTLKRGLTWDGAHLWLLVDDLVSKLDRAAQPTCQINLSSEGGRPSWYGYRGLAWDGQFLWVAHQDANLLYRVDPTTCRQVTQ